MNAIQFTTVIGPDGVIHLPVGVTLPEGEIEVSVQSRQAPVANLEARLRERAVRHGLNPDNLSEVSRTILLDELTYEERGMRPPRPGPGAFKGVITYMAPDFDAPLEDMKEYME